MKLTQNQYYGKLNERGSASKGSTFTATDTGESFVSDGNDWVSTSGDSGDSEGSLSESNSVQTVTGSISAASIDADVNVVYNNSTASITLTVETTTNIALIEIINNGSSSIALAAGSGVTLNALDSFMGTGNVGRLIKISDNNWVFTAL